MKKFIKSFFYSKGNPYPEYFYIFQLIQIVVITIVLRLLNRSSLSDELILGLCGFIAIWIGLIKHDKRKIPILPDIFNRGGIDDENKSGN